MSLATDTVRDEIMDAHALRVLDFPQIVEKLLELTQTPYGSEIAERLVPSPKLEEVQRSLAETTEAREWLDKFGDFSWGELFDLRPILARCKVAAMLHPDELLHVKAFLVLLRSIKAKMLEARAYSSLVSLAKELHALPSLEKDIEKAIGPNGEILDGASFELLRLRKQSRLIESRLRDKLQDMIESPSVRKLLQEPIITVRDQRFVIPIKQEYKSQLPGVVHDRSSSGQTVFLEPLVTLNINNELREVQLKIKQEEERILAELTAKIAEQVSELNHSIQSLARLDFIFAKARLSELYKASPPRVDAGASLQLLNARHPLLRVPAIPIEIEVGTSFRTLVITGPNTGGKTVSLKTAGLLVLMAQSGLHIPASPQSQIGVFQNLFADIGDEQSLEQSLSTFSSHLSQIVKILREAGPNTLVLLDELGAGTDPREGAALGTAILEHFHNAGARTICSTHYTELVSFAYSHREARNASLEFDSDTLSPTYRMKMGVPGASHAFLIAKRFGLSQDVLAQAQTFLTVERERLDELITHLEEERQKAEAERRRAEEAKTEALKLREEYQKQNEELKKKKKEILRSCYAEAQRVVNETRDQMEALLEQLRQEKRPSARTEAIKKEFEKAEVEVGEQAETTERRGLPVPLAKLKPGEMVWIPRFKSQGMIMEVDLETGRARVQVGTMRASVREKEIERLEGSVIPASKKKQSVSEATEGRSILPARPDISWKLDLHGERVEDGLVTLDKYLDDAVLANFPFVYILHGRGTGALRQAIHGHLRKHQSVLRFRMGESNEGGEGVTIVYLK
jgi:DNA mismatch repair protein MutS2